VRWGLVWFGPFGLVVGHVRRQRGIDDSDRHHSHCDGIASVT
jgi:hypothetical protein